MTGKRSCFDCFTLPCLFNGLETIWKVLRYILSEIIIFTTILLGSIALLQLANRVSTLVTGSLIDNAGEMFGLTFYVGLITLFFLAPLKSVIIADSLQHQFPVTMWPPLLGAIRVGFLLIVFPTSLYLQFSTYYYRHFTLAKAKNGKGGRGSSANCVEELADTPELYFNDVLFLASLVILVYSSARVVTAYREFQMKKLEFELGLPEHGPEIEIINFPYMLYCFGLTIIEIMMAVILIIFMLGLGGFLQLVFFREWFTFLVMCLAGTILGQGLGVLEMEYCPLQIFHRVKPLFRLMQWDARRTFMFSLALPSLCQIYFGKDFYLSFKEDGRLYQFILYSGLVATNVALLVRCQTVFSYGICPQVRVAPSSGSRPGGGDPESQLRGNGRIYDRVRGFGSIIKSLIAGYFPLDLNEYLRELQQRHVGRVTEFGQSSSISTGSCSSLVNRVNNNNNVLITAEAGGAKMGRFEGSTSGLKGSSTVVLVAQKLETAIKLGQQLEVREKIDLGKQKQNNDQTDSNANPVDDGDDAPDLDLKLCKMISAVHVSSSSPKGNATARKDLKKEGLPSSPSIQHVIRLKRCPSNLPTCEEETSEDSSSSIN